MILIITNIPTPYRIPLFNGINEKITKLGDSLHVLFYASTTRNKLWNDVLKDAHFQYSILNLKKIDFKSEFVFYFPSQIKRTLKKFKPDKVYVLGFSIISLLVIKYCRRNNIPVMLWSGETSNSEKQRTFVLLRRALRKYIIKRVNGFIVYGNQARKYLLSSGVDNKSVFTVINTVDTEYFRDKVKQIKSVSHNTDRKITILFVGRLVKLKGLELLFAGLEKVSGNNWEMLLVGDGKDKDYIKNKISAELKNKIIFTGYKQKHELPYYYANADIFILPSTNEIFGLVMVEAASSGLPIICSELAGGAGDIVVDNYNGFIIDPYNPKEIKNSIEKLISDNTLRIKMGNASLDIIENHINIRSAIKGFIDSYKYLHNSTDG